MFDYNPNQMAAAGLLWTAWALLFRSTALATILAMLTCLAKENLGLYIPLLAGVLAFRGAPWRRCAIVAGAALLLFAVLMLAVFPRFGGFPHFDYEDLGDTPTAAAQAAVQRAPGHAAAARGRARETAGDASAAGRHRLPGLSPTP